MNKKVLYLVHGAVIAALYVVLTMLANALGLANYAIQVRFSEALTILPVFTPAAIPGLFLGCIISNTMTGCMLLDIIFGSLATLIGAFGTYLLRDKNKWLAPLPPIIANTIIVPFVAPCYRNTANTFLTYRNKRSSRQKGVRILSQVPGAFCCPLVFNFLFSYRK